MATIATGTFSFAGNVYGTAGSQIITRKEANTQQFKRGALVGLASNLVEIIDTVQGAGVDALDVSAFETSAGANPSAAPKKIVGIALRAATNVSSGNVDIPIQILRPGDLIEGNLFDGTDGDGPPAGGDYVSVAGDVGSPVTILFDATNFRHYFSITQPGTPEVAGWVFQNDLGGGRGFIGDTNARVRVVINSRLLMVE